MEPVSSGHHPIFFPHSLFAYPSDILELQSSANVQYKLETGADDALYINDLNEVACTIEKCNKRISNAGQEWSAGRPGNRPIGARNAARNSDTYLGPSATRDCTQPHTGHNTCEEEQALSRRPRQEDQALASLQQIL